MERRFRIGNWCKDKYQFNFLVYCFAFSYQRFFFSGSVLRRDLRSGTKIWNPKLVLALSLGLLLLGFWFVSFFVFSPGSLSRMQRDTSVILLCMGTLLRNKVKLFLYQRRIMFPAHYGSRSCSLRSFITRITIVTRITFKKIYRLKGLDWLVML